MALNKHSEYHDLKEYLQTLFNNQINEQSYIRDNFATLSTQIKDLQIDKEKRAVLKEIQENSSCFVTLFNRAFGLNLPVHRYTLEDVTEVVNSLNLHLNVTDGSTFNYIRSALYNPNADGCVVATLGVTPNLTHASFLSMFQGVCTASALDMTDMNLGMPPKQNRKGNNKPTPEQTGKAVAAALVAEKKIANRGPLPRQRVRPAKMRETVPVGIRIPMRNPRPAHSGQKTTYKTRLLQQILGPSEIPAGVSVIPVPDNTTNAPVHVVQSRIETDTSVETWGNTAGSYFKGFMSGYGTNAQVFETVKALTGSSFVICDYKASTLNTNGGFQDAVPCYDDRPNALQQRILITPPDVTEYSFPLHSAYDVDANTPDKPYVSFVTPSEIYSTGDTPIIPGSSTPVPKVFTPPNTAFPLEANTSINVEYEMELTTAPPSLGTINFYAYLLNSSGNIVQVLLNGLTSISAINSFRGTFTPGSAYYGIYAITAEYVAITGNIQGIVNKAKITLTYSSGSLSRTIYQPFSAWRSVPAVSQSLSNYIMKERTTAIDVKLFDQTAVNYRGGTVMVISLEDGALDYNGFTGFASSATFLKKKVFHDSEGVYGSSTPLFNSQNVAFDKFGMRVSSPGAYQVFILKPRPRYDTPPASITFTLTSTMVLEYILNGDGMALFNPKQANHDAQIVSMLQTQINLGAVVSENPAHVLFLKHLITKALLNAGGIGTAIGGKGSRAEQYGRKISKVARVFL